MKAMTICAAAEGVTGNRDHQFVFNTTSNNPFFDRDGSGRKTSIPVVRIGNTVQLRASGLMIIARQPNTTRDDDSQSVPAALPGQQCFAKIRTFGTSCSPLKQGKAMHRLLIVLSMAAMFALSSTSYAAATLSSLEKRMIALENKVKILDGTKLRKAKTKAARNKLLKGTYRYALLESGGNAQKAATLVRFGVLRGEFTFDGKGKCTVKDTFVQSVDQNIVPDESFGLKSTHKVLTKKLTTSCTYELANSGKLTLSIGLEFLMSRDLQMGVSAWIDEEGIPGGRSRIANMATLIRKN